MQSPKKQRVAVQRSVDSLVRIRHMIGAALQLLKDSPELEDVTAELRLVLRLLDREIKRVSN